MEEIEISDAVPQDARAITNVLHKAWLATYPNKKIGITVEDIEDSYKDAYSEESLQKMQNRIAEGRENEKRLVAKRGDLVVGTATMIRNKEHNQLRTIYVLPEFQGKGIGTTLWNEIRKFCDPTKDTFVQVATYNQQALYFYKKLGFIDTGKRFTDEKGKMRNGAVIPEMEMILKA